MALLSPLPDGLKFKLPPSLTEDAIKLKSEACQRLLPNVSDVMLDNVDTYPQADPMVIESAYFSF